MGTPSSVSIIEYVYLALKVLEIVYHTNGAAVEGLAHTNWTRRIKVGKG